MKNNIWRLLVAATVMCVCGCEAEFKEADSPKGERYTITASCADTKTVSDGMSTKWSSGDELAVIYPSGSKTAVSCFSYEGGDSFTGELTNPTKSGSWYAVYPYAAAISDPAKVGVNFPAASAQSGNDSMAQLAGEGFPLWGSATAEGEVPSFTMNQFASVVRFVVTNREDSPIRITGISFTAPADIAGQFSADITGSEPEFTAVSASKKATLTVSDGSEIASGASASFYMGLKPFEATGAYNITITATVGGKTQKCVKDIAGMKMAMGAGKVNTLKLGFTVTPEPKDCYEIVTAEPESWNGTYLIVSADDKKAFIPVQGASPNSASVTVTDGKIISDGTVDEYAVTIEDAGKVHPASKENLEAYNIKKGSKYMMFSQEVIYFESSEKHSNSSGTYTYYHTLKYDGGVQLVSAQTMTTSNYYYMVCNGSTFTYGKNVTTNRVHLYRLVKAGSGEPDQPDDTDEPDPDEPDEPDEPVEPAMNVNQGTFNLVNSTIQPYLTAAAAQYKEDGSDWNSYSIVASYPNGKNGDLSQSNTNIVAYDRPAPVELTIEGYDGKTASVTVYNNAEMTKVEDTRTGTISNSKFEFYNLIPGSNYWYSASVGGNVVSTGYFSTTGARRLMKISDKVYADNGNNCRDFGGLKTEDGKTLRYNLLFRGTNIDGTSAEEQAYMKRYMHIGMEVDLRSTTTYEKRNKAMQVLGVGYDAQSYSGGSDMTNANKMKATIGNIFGAVADGKACYIHCYAGADRTGYLCALLEALCGVSIKDCTIDYELTSFSCVGTRDRNGVKKRAAFNERFPDLVNYNGSTLKEKAENLVMSFGIDKKDIEAFQAKMVE